MNSQGFSYIEAMVAVILLTVALVPILQVLSPMQASSTEEQYLILLAARSRMEAVQALDFNAIPVGVSLSDDAVVRGRNVPRNVTVSLYDVNGDSVLDVDAKKITVRVEGIQLEALKVRY